MKKTCVYIIGTNGVGKSSVARCLQHKYGGIESSTRELTICKDHRICFAGKYIEGSNYGGVDYLNKTGELRGLVSDALKDHDVIFCEGSFLDTFGINTTTAIMQAERQLIVLLVASPSVLSKRLAERSKGKEKQNKLPKTTILNKQSRCIRAAKKYKAAFVPVLTIITDNLSVEQISDLIIENL